MEKIGFSLLLLIIFILSLLFRSSFVLISILIGSFIAILNNFYNLDFNIGDFKIFSEIAISIIFFSLGLGYTFEGFYKNIKKTIFGSLMDLLNLLIPFFVTLIITHNFFLSLLVGLLIYPSSTAIVVKILEFRKKLASKAAEIMVGILLFEDIVLIVILSILSSKTSLFSLQTISLTVLCITTLFLFSKLLNKYSLFFERYLQEESGIFFVLGYFLLIHYFCLYFHLPESLIIFLAGILIPQQISYTIKSKIEIFKNFSIGIFVIDFLMKTKFELITIPNLILIITPLFVIIKILTIYLAFRKLKVKFKVEDLIYFLPRGEFSAYISKLGQLELVAFISIIFSNLITLFFKILQQRTIDKQKKQEKQYTL